MINAAGVLALTKTGLVLLVKRGMGSDHPGEWCFPGGQQEDGESIEATAIREFTEETGYILPEGLDLHTRSIALAETAPPEALQSEDVDYTTFRASLDDVFIPVLCNESTGYAWADPAYPPEPLHPGCRVALARLTMDEHDVALAISADQLLSPQWYENAMLFAVRITGTGKAYRSSMKEFVWRDPELYLNQKFLDRCNGLPVIWEHPENGTLNSKEFVKRIIGTIVLPYIKGEEVWGIARILDLKAAEAMIKDQMSTSPAVVFRDLEVNEKLTMANGDIWLIEGKPSHLDHLAICAQGVWDKGAEPSGVIIADSVVESPSETPLLNPEQLGHLSQGLRLLDVRLGGYFNGE